jgi:hypothetical protein
VKRALPKSNSLATNTKSNLRLAMFISRLGSSKRYASAKSTYEKRVRQAFCNYEKMPEKANGRAISKLQSGRRQRRRFIRQRPGGLLRNMAPFVVFDERKELQPPQPPQNVGLGEPNAGLDLGPVARFIGGARA